MEQRGANAVWVIGLTFGAAFLLAIFPLPQWLAVARPDWVALVLIYWVVALPQRVGIFIAFIVGILLDVLEGAAMGQNALSFTLVAFLALILYQRLRVFNLGQQAAVVFMLLSMNQLLAQWVQNLTSSGADTLLFLMPALVGALLWPGVLVSLRSVRRHYRVS